MPLGSARSVRFARGLALTVLVVGLTVVGAGSAGAAATANADFDQSRPVALVLGVPLTTAAWAMLGLVLMLAGMFVSSRSNRRSAVSLVAANGPAADLVATAVSVR